MVWSPRTHQNQLLLLQCLFSLSFPQSYCLTILLPKRFFNSKGNWASLQKQRQGKKTMISLFSLPFHLWDLFSKLGDSTYWCQRVQNRHSVTDVILFNVNHFHITDFIYLFHLRWNFHVYRLPILKILI